MKNLATSLKFAHSLSNLEGNFSNLASNLVKNQAKSGGISSNLSDLFQRFSDYFNLKSVHAGKLRIGFTTSATSEPTLLNLVF